MHETKNTENTIPLARSWTTPKPQGNEFLPLPQIATSHPPLVTKSTCQFWSDIPSRYCANSWILVQKGRRRSRLLLRLARSRSRRCLGVAHRMSKPHYSNTTADTGPLRVPFTRAYGRHTSCRILVIVLTSKPFRYLRITLYWPSDASDFLGHRLTTPRHGKRRKN